MCKKLYYTLIVFVFTMIIHLNVFGATASEETLTKSFTDAEEQCEVADLILLDYKDCKYTYTGVDDPPYIKESTVIINNTDSYPDIDAYGFYSTTSGSYLFSIKATNSVTIQITDKADNNLYEFFMEDKFESEFFINLPIDSEYIIKIKGCSSIDEYQFYLVPVSEVFGDYTENIKKIYLNSPVEGSLDSYQDFDYFSFIPEKTGPYQINTHFLEFDIVVLNSQGKEIENMSGYYVLLEDTKYYMKLSDDSYYDFPREYEISIREITEYYYNDNMENAERRDINELIYGNLILDKDVDYFWFVPKKSGVYVLETYVEEQGSQYTAVVLNEENQEMISYSGKFILEKDRKYYIRLFNGSSSKVFNEYGFSMSGPLMEDYGDALESALDIEIGSIVSGSLILDKDVDYFCFIPEISGTYKLEMFDSKSKAVLLNWCNDEVEKLFDYYVLEEGMEYYVKLFGASDSEFCTEYEFSVCGPVVEDYGNDMGSALEIEIGSKVSGSLILDKDVDYFCFIPEKTGAYKLNFPENGLETLGYRLTITDSSRNRIGNLSGYFNLSENQKYYIKVWNGDSDKLNTQYSFSITGPLEDDYGDTISTSQAIIIGQEYQGSIYYWGDYDVFSFTADSIDCRVDAQSLEGQNIELYDSSNNLVSCYEGKTLITGIYNSAIKGLENKPESTILYDNLQVGNTYYLKIGRDATPTYYTFMLESFGDDYGNTFFSAKTIDAATPVTGKSNYIYDVDTFKFIPEFSGTYSIRSLDGKELDISVAKSQPDSFPELLASNNSGSLSLSCDLQKGEIYYIYINPDYETGYSFIIEEAEFKMGDVNGDNRINSIDFANLRMFLLGMIDEFPSQFGQDAADINQDGSVNSIDFALLRQYLLGIIDTRLNL